MSGVFEKDIDQIDISELEDVSANTNLRKVYKVGQKMSVVIEKIDPIHGVGRVEVNGMEWSAKTEESGEIEKDTIVSIKGIQGVKLIVEKEEV